VGEQKTGGEYDAKYRCGEEGTRGVDRSFSRLVQGRDVGEERFVLRLVPRGPQCIAVIRVPRARGSLAPGRSTGWPCRQ
jgi:hypothetical protein